MNVYVHYGIIIIFLYAGIDGDTIENSGDVIETSGDDDTE